MQKSVNWLILFILVIVSCQKEDNSVLSAFSVYCEMVANDAKPVALHYPMQNTEVDQWWNEFTRVAEEHQVQLYREDDFPNTTLFPSEATEGKTVVLIYKGDRLKQYEQWKTDVLALSNDSKASEALARRFGRLLGYSPQGINLLLSKNASYQSLSSFNVTQQVTHLYYEDVNEASGFYQNTLGFTKIDSAIFQISTDAFIEIHPLNENHPKGQAKSTAIAFLTDQLAEWYQYLQTENIPIKYTYKPKEGGPHDGFVAIDPGGYLLEFEQFKQHPENELFMAALVQANRVETTVDKLNFYGSITWTYHKDMLLMQTFYEDVLGYQLVADQGWTKIYQTSKTGFIGLVDERRGMEDFATTKAVEIEWKIEDEIGFNSYANEFWEQYTYSNNAFIGPEKYLYRITKGE